MRTKTPCILLALAALSWAGCYPDEKTASIHSGLQMPLGEVGIQLEQAQLQRWLDWAQEGFDGEPFDVSEPGNDFALYLRLFDQDGWPVSFQGDSITLEDQGGEEHLLVDMHIDPCTGCRFDLALFWRDLELQGQPVEIFYGQSDVFSAQQEGDLADGLSATVEERATGRVLALAGDGDVAELDGAWVAARDPIANVRLPHTRVQAGDNIPAILTGVPLDREMTIELDPLADGRFYSPFASILLESSEGEVTLP